LKKIKRNVVSLANSQKTIDSNYDVAHANFEELVKFVEGIKKNFATHLSHMKGWIQTSTQMTGEFNTFFQKTPNHRLTGFLDETKRVQDEFQHQAETDEKTTEGAALKRLTAIWDLFVAMRGRMKARDEAKNNFDYYASKIKRIHESRDKEKAHGKPETQKEVEERERNERKFEDATVTYQSSNAQVIKDLTQLWDTRIDYLGPVLAEIISGDLAFANACTDLKSITLPPTPPFAIEFKSALPTNSLQSTTPLNLQPIQPIQPVQPVQASPTSQTAAQNSDPLAPQLPASPPPQSPPPSQQPKPTSPGNDWM